MLTPKRWPKGTVKGDFIEMRVTDYGEFAENPARMFFDPTTQKAVENFFVNGGQVCHLFGLCLESEADLCIEDPFSTLFAALLDRLRGEEDLGLLAMPILAYLQVHYDRRGRVTLAYQPTLEMFLTHCREMNNRFLIIDTPRDLHDEALVDWVSRFREKNRESASYGAIYYPWLMDGDRSFPPSGSVAGVYARTEREHAPFGVRWPPANQEIRGVTHPAVPVKWRESDGLNAAHINPILTQPGRGVVIWGARTLSLDPRWMHINARRIVSLVSEQLRRDSEWVVFENQRPELWEIVARTVRSRLDQLWGAGLLTGDQAGLDYHVQCDAELNPLEVRNAGIVNVAVTLRPISTAEFIIVELRLGL